MLIVRRASNIIDSQRAILKTQLENAQALAEQNRRLRKGADKARMDATKSNETLLNRIGSDLHDGPVQLLGLLILTWRRLLRTNEIVSSAEKYAPGSSSLTSGNRCFGSCANFRRDGSSGDREPVARGSLRVAVERHEYATGSVVGASSVGLPEHVTYPLKICLYSIVQEGFNNTFRHASGLSQHVTASADEKAIKVIVSDAGPGRWADGATVRADPLGLQGIRNRVEAFGGTVQFQQHQVMIRN